MPIKINDVSDPNLYFLKPFKSTFISECTGLNPTWSNLKTETQFPVVYGTVVTVTCDPGYELQGSNTVTCNIDTTFTFQDQPTCEQLGKFLKYLSK